MKQKHVKTEIIGMLGRLEVKDNEVIILHMRDCNNVNTLHKCISDFSKRNGLRSFFILTTDRELKLSKMSVEQLKQKIKAFENEAKIRENTFNANIILNL